MAAHTPDGQLVVALQRGFSLIEGSSHTEDDGVQGVDVRSGNARLDMSVEIERHERGRHGRRDSSPIERCTSSMASRVE